MRNGTCTPDISEKTQTQAQLNPAKKQKTHSSVDKTDEELYTMDEPKKRANFSSFGNHFHDRSPLANSKPGQAKKLVIKNFKGKTGVISAFLAVF